MLKVLPKGKVQRVRIIAKNKSLEQSKQVFGAVSRGGSSVASNWLTVEALGEYVRELHKTKGTDRDNLETRLLSLLEGHRNYYHMENAQDLFLHLVSAFAASSLLGKVLFWPRSNNFNPIKMPSPLPHLPEFIKLGDAKSGSLSWELKTHLSVPNYITPPIGGDEHVTGASMPPVLIIKVNRRLSTPGLFNMQPSYFDGRVVLDPRIKLKSDVDSHYHLIAAMGNEVNEHYPNITEGKHQVLVFKRGRTWYQVAGDPQELFGIDQEQAELFAKARGELMIFQLNDVDTFKEEFKILEEEAKQRNADITGLRALTVLRTQAVHAHQQALQIARRAQVSA